MSAKPSPPKSLDQLGDDFARLARERPVGPLRSLIGRVPVSALIAGALVLVVAASFTPPGRAIAEDVAELVGIGDPPTVDHDAQGGPFRPTTDEIVIGTGSTPDGVPFEIVAFEGERTEAEIEKIQELPGPPPPAVALDRYIGTCVSLDWIDRADSRGGAICVDRPQVNPLPTPGATDPEGRFGPGAALIVSGLTGPTVDRLDLIYTNHEGERVEAPVTLAKLEGQLAERAKTEQEFGFFVGFLPDEDVGEGGYFADVMTTVELIAYRADGEEIKRLDYGQVIENSITERESSQADTSKARSGSSSRCPNAC